MTREEAIQRFNGIINAMSISIAQSKFYPSKAKLNELCDMAIEALKANDEINEMNREIIKDILKIMPTAYLLEALGVTTFEELMESADRPHGEWINRENCQVDEDAYEIATCSHCNAEITLEYPYDNFCPNCGALMGGDGE